MTTQNVIQRTNVVQGRYTEDDFRKSKFPTEAQSASVTLTTADVHDLDSASVELVPAPPAGCYISVERIRASKAADAYGGTGSLRFRYGTGTREFGTVPHSFCSNSSAVDAWATATAPVAPPNDAWPEAEALVVDTGGNLTGAGGDIDITVTYAVLSF